MPKLLLLVLLCFVFSMSAKASTLEDEYFFRGRHYAISYSVAENLQTIVLTGNVLSGIVEDLDGFNAVKRKIRQGLNLKLILSNNGGGFQSLFNGFSDKVKGACYKKQYSERRNGSRRFLGWGEKSCTITTVVESSSYCASACIPLFMVGDLRQAGRWAEFGFHQAAVVPGALRIPGMVERDLREAGVDANWIRANEQLFDSLNLTFLRPTDMAGSNIVTEIIE